MPDLELTHIAWSKALAGRHLLNLADSAVATPDLRAMGLPYRAELPLAGDGGIEALASALGGRMGAPGGRVLVAAGASEANACVWAGLLEPGDEVLIEHPGYQPHRDAPRLFGLELRSFPREGDGALAERIERALGPSTRMVVVSHLHNPSGAPLPQDQIGELDRLAERRGLWILCDETFRDAAPLPLGTLAGTGPRWVATGSLTKSYGLGGLRIGWVSGEPATLARCAAAQNGLSVVPAAPSVALAFELVPHLDALRARSHRLLAANRESFRRRIQDALGLRVPQPSQGTTTWALFAEEGMGDAFAEYAAARRSVALTPGRFFGDSRGIRIGLGSEPEHFEAAMEAFEQALVDFARTPVAARSRGPA